MQWDGPDSVNSWLISLACCFINMMTFGMARLSGVLFVASIPRFKVGRKQASFPYTFASFLRNVSGPLVGYLGHKFGVRTITSIGALIGALGAGLCYFAESIDIVTFLWGAVFGLGFGLGNVLLPIAINQYFDKHRATASGISFAGGCLGSFVLPPIVDILLNNYGLSETYLFLSGFILNCVPAALLLRKPSFKIKKKILWEQKETVNQHINRGTNTPIYELETDTNMPGTLENRDSEMNINPADKANSVQNLTTLTYEEQTKKLSTQTLLSACSVHMSPSEILDRGIIMENVSTNGQVDLKTLQRDTSCLSLNDCVHDKKSEKHVVFNRDTHYSNLCSEENVQCFVISNNLTNIHNFYSKENDKVEVGSSESYQNYNYQPCTDKIHDTNEIRNNIHVIECCKSTEPEHIDKDYMKLNLRCPIELICSNESIKKSSRNLLEYSETPKCSNDKCEKEAEKNFQYRQSKIISALGSFSIIFDPMFLLIAITNGIYTSSFVCMVTIIVDFSRDLQVEASYEKYILMLLSVGDIVGRLGLGWITDRGYMTTTTFAALCFGCQGLSTAAIVWSNNFISLGVLVTLYGLAQAGLIVIFPIIIAKFIEHDKQTVAIPSSHFLSGPLCLAVAPLIGYFRDEIGSYSSIFYGITVLSTACSVSWMFAPCIDKCRRKN